MTDRQTDRQTNVELFYPLMEQEESGGTAAGSDAKQTETHTNDSMHRSIINSERVTQQRFLLTLKGHGRAFDVSLSF